MSLDLFSSQSIVTNNHHSTVDDNNNNTTTTKAKNIIHNNKSDLQNMSSSPSSSSTQHHTGSSGPVTAISSYLKHLFGLNAKTTKRTLSEEAECGSPESIQEWLRQGSNANECDAYGYTPLVNACLRGCTKSAKILLGNGADVNLKAMHGYSPLHAASQVNILTKISINYTHLYLLIQNKEWLC